MVRPETQQIVTSDRSGRRLRIAYLCDADPVTSRLYSGGNRRIHDALATHVGDVEILPQHWGLAEPLRRLIEAMPDSITMRMRWRMHLLCAPLIAKVIDRALRQGDYDVLFCAYSYHSLYAVKPPPGLPVAYTSDATPSVYRNSVVGRNFGSYLKLSRYFDPLVEATERRVFRAADILLWPSDWLRTRANKRYGLDPERSYKVPWGANIEDPSPANPAPTLSDGGPLRLLFVGRDWNAKGGPTTLSTLRDLQNRGISARLTIVGCDPEEARGLPGVRIHPYLDKSKPDQLAKFEALYRESHFMMLPSFESFGFAFCEASAYGLPSLCLSVGGVPVDDGMNGHALDIDASARDFADQIAHYVERPEDYGTLRITTRQTYETTLNWDAWAKRVGEIIAARLARQEPETVSSPGIAEAPISDPSPSRRPQQFGT